MNKKKTAISNLKEAKALREEIKESHLLIQDTIIFWQSKMDDVIERMNASDSIPDWHPKKEDVYHELNLEMQFILTKLEAEEREVDILEEKTNKFLAAELFKKISNGKKKE
jgi:hypothetical protein